MQEIILTPINTKFTKKFLKNLQKMPAHTRERIQGKLSEILKAKRPTNIKKLSNYPLADYRLKINEFRLFFSFSEKDNISLFVACIARKNLY